MFHNACFFKVACECTHLCAHLWRSLSPNPEGKTFFGGGAPSSPAIPPAAGGQGSRRRGSGGRQSSAAAGRAQSPRDRKPRVGELGGFPSSGGHSPLKKTRICSGRTPDNSLRRPAGPPQPAMPVCLGKGRHLRPVSPPGLFPPRTSKGRVLRGPMILGRSPLESESCASGWIRNIRAQWTIGRLPGGVPEGVDGCRPRPRGAKKLD